MYITKLKKVKGKVAQFCLFATPWTIYGPWNSPGQNTGVGSLSLLQGIFPTQGLDSGLPHCGQVLYQLSHKGSPKRKQPILKGYILYNYNYVTLWKRNNYGDLKGQ